MATNIGCRGIGVELDGPAEVVAAVQAQLPRFFTAQAETVESITIEERDGVFTLAAPDGLSVSGLNDVGFARAASSRIELLITDRLNSTKSAMHACTAPQRLA